MANERVKRQGDSPAELNNVNKVGADVREVLLSLGDRGAMPYRESRVQEDIQRILQKWPVLFELNKPRGFGD